MASHNFQKDLDFLLFATFSILILLLTIFNLQNLNTKKISKIQVLGAETNNLFWEEFMSKHPTYIEGWVELGRIDKVEEIDPNF
ncbi:MAG TPA: hypothetical protein VI795_04110 [Patescibacteria group bacterium]|nr:hypothetical protein [Patescibacteria group bacterium]